MFDQKTLLVTGGTGTFGNAVLRRLLDTGIAEIRIFSRDEKKQEDMRRACASPKVTFHIGDVRDYDSVAAAMTGVHYVFHAAALKQVPSCEFYPLEAIRTNALGAENIMQAAAAAGVERVVLLSTDKAVYPINAMGLSKAMMEKLMLARARRAKGGTIFCATRCGNVMASRGSVIPLLTRLVREDRPLTVTDPRMTRFMMSIDDAVDLVLHAYAHAHQGDIFVPKAPAATVETLALAVKRVFQASNPVQVIGTRHGEKLHETLLTREERARAEELGACFRVPLDARDMNYTVSVGEGRRDITEYEDYDSRHADQLDVDAMADLLLTLDDVRAELAVRTRHDGAAAVRA